MIKYLRMTCIVVLALVIIASCTFGGRYFTDPASYTHTIEALDQSRSNVLGMSAAAALASSAISALPTDICSPISTELSELSTYFLFILSVIYLEKYTLTILGAAACYVLIPIGCSMLLICFFYFSEFLRNLGAKLTIFGLILLLVLPTSIWVTDKINEVYEESIEITVASANSISANLTEKTVNQQEETSVIEAAKDILDTTNGAVANVLTQLKNVMNRFIEGIAVLIVTNCAVPVLVILFYSWVVKTLFGVQFAVPRPPRMEKTRQFLNDYRKGGYRKATEPVIPRSIADEPALPEKNSKEEE